MKLMTMITSFQLILLTTYCHGFTTTLRDNQSFLSKNVMTNFRHGRILTHANTVSPVFMEGNRIYTAAETKSIIRPLKQPLPNQIPDLDPSTSSKLSIEFYDMMTAFAQFTPLDIQSIKSQRYRSLYEGVLAGANEPKVMNAFCIVFEDYLPIRLAGRMIYKHLKNIMEQSIREREEMEQKLVDTGGFQLHTIDNGRHLYSLAIMDDLDDGDGQLSLQDLIDSGIVEMVVELFEFDSFDAFIEQIEKNEDGKITFENFMVGLQKCATTNINGGDDECELVCDLDEVLTEVVARMQPLERAKRKDAPAREKKHSDQYDLMVKSFEQWEGMIPASGDGRLIQVLDGCFSGAKDQKIVAALKTVYMDYSALRIGGDLVFKLMRKLVERK